MCQHDGNIVDFMIRGRLTREIGRSGAQGSALTRNVARSHGSKNLLQRAILCRHKRISHSQGRLQAKNRRNYVYICVGFSSKSQDLSVRLGSRLVWHEILSVCFSGSQRDHPENTYEKNLGGTRCVSMMEIL